MFVRFFDIAKAVACITSSLPGLTTATLCIRRSVDHLQHPTAVSLGLAAGDTADLLLLLLLPTTTTTPRPATTTTRSLTPQVTNRSTAGRSAARCRCSCHTTCDTRYAYHPNSDRRTSTWWSIFKQLFQHYQQHCFVRQQNSQDAFRVPF